MKRFFIVCGILLGFWAFMLLIGVVVLMLYPDIQSLSQARSTLDLKIKPVIGAFRVLIFICLILYWPALIAWVGKKLQWTSDEITDITTRYRIPAALWLAAVEIIIIRNGIGALLSTLNGTGG